MQLFESQQHQHYPTATTFGDGSKFRVNQNSLTGDEEDIPKELHYHKKSTVLILVTQGELHVEVEGSLVRITPGKLLQIEPKEKYRTLKSMGPTNVIVVGTYNEPGDRVVVSD